MHTTVAATVVTATVAGLTVMYQPTSMRFPVIVVLLICVVVSLPTNGFVGLSVGLVGAAAVVALHRWLSTWHSLDFVPTVVVALLVVGTGWTAGACGAQLRELWQRMAAPSEGAAGSLGLFSREAAEFRLAEEVGRARDFSRPLSVAVINVRFHEGVDAADRAAGSRAVGRLIESGLGVIDTPFDSTARRTSPQSDQEDAADAEFGALLPERSSVDAWKAIGPIVASARTATYVVRGTTPEQPDRRNLLDISDISVGIVTLTHSSNPASLIESARGAALRPATPEELREHHSLD